MPLRPRKSIQRPEPVLHGFDANPVPDRATVGRFMAADGIGLRYALFAPKGDSHRGTVVILPGRNECIEKYFETIRDLQRRGLGVAVMDWRGQGGSDRLLRDRARGHIRDFAAYVSDLERFFEEVVLPDCRAPFFALGHSTGGLIALMAAPSMVNRFRRMVLSTPLLELTNLPLSIRNVERVTGLLYRIGLGRLYFGSGRRPPGGAPFEGNVLTSDAFRYGRNQAIYDRFPDLAMSGPTAAWVRAACAAARRVQNPDFMVALTVPTLIVAAGDDRVVSTRAIERFAVNLRAGSVTTIDHARHELLQERDLFREQFLAAFDAFVPGET